jgi:hypothetical protein
MMSMMKKYEEKCEDLYEYECGGITEKRNIIKNNNEYEVWKRIDGELKKINIKSNEELRKLKSLYDKCLMFE